MFKVSGTVDNYLWRLEYCISVQSVKKEESKTHRLTLLTIALAGTLCLSFEAPISVIDVPITGSSADTAATLWSACLISTTRLIHNGVTLPPPRAHQTALKSIIKSPFLPDFFSAPQSPPSQAYMVCGRPLLFFRHVGCKCIHHAIQLAPYFSWYGGGFWNWQALLSTARSPLDVL